MYADVFCKVYNELGWNYYPEAFGEELLVWLKQQGRSPENALDLGCGTGVLCRLLKSAGIRASGMDLSSGMIDIARESDPEGKYAVADMVTYRPEDTFDLVTCTGDALNHIPSLSDVGLIFDHVYECLRPGGCFVFDILNGKEGSSDEPFEIDFDETLRVWFRMTRPGEDQVNLNIRGYENGVQTFEENIRETIHDPELLCRMLQERGFNLLRCANTLTEGGNPGSTWYLIAEK